MKYVLLPPLSTTEREALIASIKESGGIRADNPIVVDENGDVLDGHHRKQIADELGLPICERVYQVQGRNATEAEKQAFVYQANLARRNLSVDQKREILTAMKAVAFMLKTEDETRTQAQIAALLGVDQSQVSRWIATIMQAHNGCKESVPAPPAPQPVGCRVKVAPAAKPKIAERIKAGETQEQVAADYGITHQAVSRIVQKERKKAEAVEARRQAAAAIAAIDQRILIGDFRAHQNAILDASLSLIFTDPPYDRKASEMLPDLALFASQKLLPGGSLLCYAGQTQLPAAMAAFSQHLRYWWIIAVIYETGKFTAMHEYGINACWKPILWFVKGTRAGSIDFVDDIVSGGREKDAHIWQQAESEAVYWIGKLCPPDGVVCDPFLGGGTTAVAASKLNRHWIAMEISEESAKIASGRLQAKGDAA